MWLPVAELIVAAVVTEVVDRLMEDQPSQLGKCCELATSILASQQNGKKNMFERLLVVAIATAIARAVENASKD